MEADPLYPWSDQLPMDTSLIPYWTSHDIPDTGRNDPPSDYPTTRTLVYCAWLVYKNNAQELIQNTNELKGWKILVKCKSRIGYRGLGLWHFQHRQLIIAHSVNKISNIESLRANREGTDPGEIPSQMLSAITFTHHVLAKLQDIPDNVFMVGHSLGGWLAAIGTYTAQYLNLVNNHFVYKKENTMFLRPHTVTFDAPGSQEILTKLQDSYEARLQDFNTLRELDITNLVLGPSSNNTHNHHVGILIRVANTHSHTTSDHSIETFKHIFNRAGNISGDLNKIIDWPVFGTDLEKSINWDTEMQTIKGYNPIRYRTETYSESQTTMVAFHPLAREFLNVYKDITKSSDGFMADLMEARTLKLLQSCSIVNEVLVCKTPKEKRQLIPRLNRMCQDNVDIAFQILTRRNIHNIQTSMQLQFNPNNTISKESQFNSDLNIICEDRLEVALQRLHQAKKCNEKQTLVLTEADLVHLETLQETKKQIRKKSHAFSTIISCTTFKLYKECIALIVMLGIQFWTVTTNVSRIAKFWKAVDDSYISMKKTKWRDLDIKTQHQLLQRKLIIFQDQPEPLSISDIIPGIENGDEGLESVFDEETIEKIILNRNIKVLKAPKPPPENYINRKLYIRELKPNCLEKISETHSCFVKGVDKILQKKYTIELKNAHKVHFVDDFESVDTNENTLFLEYDQAKETFLVVNIKGENDKINNFIQDFSITEDDVLRNNQDCSRVTLICGEPGVGKSSLLKSIFSKLKTKKPHSIVLYLNLNEYTAVFRNYNNRMILLDTYSSFVEFLTEDLLKLGRFEKHFLSYILHCSYTTILLDSFDEVSHDDMDFVLYFVFALKRITKVCQMFICTRSHLVNVFENSFLASSLTLMKFDEHEKNEFLRQDIKNYDKFDGIQQIFRANVPFFAELTNNPLVLGMLAADEVITSIRSISDLFRQFIEGKVSKYMSEIPDTMGNIAINNFGLAKARVFDLYEKLARILQDEYSENNGKLTFSDNDEKMMIKIGLVEKSTQAMHFVHRTFAEYFLANWLLRLLHQSHAVLPSLNFHILDTLMVKRQYKNTRSFLNEMLSYETTSPILPLPQEWLNELERFRKNNIPLFLLTSIREGHSGILKYFWVRFGNETMVELSTGKYSWTILHEAAIYQNYDIIDFLEENLPNEILEKKIECQNEEELHFTGDTYIHLFLRHKKVTLHITERMRQTIEHLVRHERTMLRLLRNAHLYDRQRGEFINFNNFCITEGVAVSQSVKNAIKPKKPDTLNVLESISNIKQWTVKGAKGNTPLHWAALRGKFNILMYVRSQFRNNDCLRWNNNDGQSVLHWAMISTTYVASELQELLDTITDVNLWSVKDDKGNTPLHVAVRWGKYKMVMHLRKKIANNDFFSWKNKGGQTVLHWTMVSSTDQDLDLVKDDKGNTPIHCAARWGKLNVLMHLRRQTQNNDYLVCKNNCGQTVFHWALMNNTTKHSDLLEFLETITDLYMWSLRDDKGNTPIHCAALHKNYNVLMHVRKQMPDNDYLSWKNKSGQTVLHWVMLSTCADSKLLKYLKKMTDIDRNLWSVRDNEGNTPLHCAARLGKYKVLMYVRNKILNSECLRWWNNDGESVLHWAMVNSTCDDSELLKLLEDITDISIWSVKDYKGNTPLHVAAQCGKYIVFMNVRKNIRDKECLSLKNHVGQNVLHLAMSSTTCDDLELKALLKTITYKKLWLVKDNYGNTPLHVAAQRGKYKVLMYVQQNRNYECLFVKNDVGETVLHWAMLATPFNDLDFTKWLKTITISQIWSVIDDNGNTPLHFAAMCGKYNVLMSVQQQHSNDKYLLCKNDDDETVLHWAMSGGSSDDSEFMYWLETITDISLFSVKDDKDITPLHLAALWGKYKVLMYVRNQIPSNDYLSWRNDDDETVLHWAMSKCDDDSELLEWLKTINDINLWSVRNDKGNTPLHDAAEYRQYKILFHVHNQIPSNEYMSWKNNDGESVLQLSIEYSETEDMKLLELLGTITDMNLWSMENNKGQTPLHFAAASKNFKVLMYVRNQIQNNECLSWKTNAGQSILHWVLLDGSYDDTNLREWLESITDMNLWTVREKKGNTPLNFAASRGHYKLLLYVQKHFQNNEYLGWKNSDGDTVLHQAILSSESKDSELLELLGMITDINMWSIKNDMGETPLHFAAQCGNHKVLIYAQTQIQNNEFLSWRNNDGETVFHEVMKARSGNDSEILEWLKTKTDINLWSVKDDKGNTPLHCAALCGKYKVLMYVRNQIVSNECLRWINNDGQSVLHCAMMSPIYDDSELQELLETITDIDLWSVRDEKLHTPLHSAGLFGKCKVLMYVHNKIPNNDYLNWKTNSDETALHCAVFCDVKEMDTPGRELHRLQWIKSLNNVNVWFSRNVRGNTPLHYAAIRNLFKILLIVHDEMPNLEYLNCKNSVHRTVWQYAIKNAVKLKKTGEMLIWAHHVNIWSLKDVSGNTPLHQAALNGYYLILRDVNEKMQNLKYLGWENNKQQTVLHRAMQFIGNAMHRSELLEWVKFFTQDTHIWTMVDAYGNTPVHYAARSGHFHVLIYVHPLLKTEEYLLRTNASGETAVHLAMQCEIQESEHEEELVQWISMCTDPHGVLQKTDGDGNTPAHYAAYHGHFNVLASVHPTMQTTDYLRKQNLDGYTPLHMAMQCLCCGPDFQNWVQMIKDDVAWVIPDAEGKTPVHYVGDLLCVEAGILAYCKRTIEQNGASTTGEFEGTS